jgi:hypothetical protein
LFCAPRYYNINQQPAQQFAFAEAAGYGEVKAAPHNEKHAASKLVLLREVTETEFRSKCNGWVVRGSGKAYFHNGVNMSVNDEPAWISDFGDRKWRDEKEQLHRVAGPACISSTGFEYYNHGDAHRIGAPSEIRMVCCTYHVHFHMQCNNFGLFHNDHGWASKSFRIGRYSDGSFDGTFEFDAEEYWLKGRRVTADEWNALKSSIPAAEQRFAARWGDATLKMRLLAHLAMGNNAEGAVKALLSGLALEPM